MSYVVIYDCDWLHSDDTLMMPRPHRQAQGGGLVVGHHAADVRSGNSLAKIWKTPVRKKRPPFCRVKSWQKKRKSEMKLKMMDRIMRAWTAWIHSATH